MSRALVALSLLAGLTACGPRARSYAWFRAHPDAAAQVASGCAANRSEDCANAEKAVADAASDRRQAMYRKEF